MVVDNVGLHPSVVEKGDEPFELRAVGEPLRVFIFGVGVAKIECYVHEFVNVLTCQCVSGADELC